MLAAQKGHLEVCRLLLQRDANPNLTNQVMIVAAAMPVAESGSDGVAEATVTGRVKQLKPLRLLLCAHIPSQSTHIAPIRVYVCPCFGDLLAYLLVKHGSTALLTAARNRQAGVCALLFERGADPELSDSVIICLFLPAVTAAAAAAHANSVVADADAANNNTVAKTVADAVANTAAETNAAIIAATTDTKTAATPFLLSNEHSYTHSLQLLQPLRAYSLRGLARCLQLLLFCWI